MQSERWCIARVGIFGKADCKGRDNFTYCSLTWISHQRTSQTNIIIRKALYRGLEHDLPANRHCRVLRHGLSVQLIHCG